MSKVNQDVSSYLAKSDECNPEAAMGNLDTDQESSMLLVFKLGKNDRRALYNLMTRNGHLSYIDTLVKLIREEVVRTGV